MVWAHMVELTKDAVESGGSSEVVLGEAKEISHSAGIQSALRGIVGRSVQGSFSGNRVLVGSHGFRIGGSS
jgi:hypothetical protein